MSRTKTIARISGALSLFLAASITAAVVVMSLNYAFQNDSGHTGFSFSILWLGSLPALLLGALAASVCRTPFTRAGAFALSVAAAFATAIPPFFEHTAILRQYDAWATTDMAMPPQNRNFILALFAVAFVLLLLTATILPFVLSNSRNTQACAEANSSGRHGT